MIPLLCCRRPPLAAAAQSDAAAVAARWRRLSDDFAAEVKTAERQLLISGTAAVAAFDAAGVRRWVGAWSEWQVNGSAPPPQRCVRAVNGSALPAAPQRKRRPLRVRHRLRRRRPWQQQRWTATVGKQQQQQTSNSAQQQQTCSSSSSNGQAMWLLEIFEILASLTKIFKIANICPKFSLPCGQPRKSECRPAPAPDCSWGLNWVDTLFAAPTRQKPGLFAPRAAPHLQFTNRQNHPVTKHYLP